MNFWSAARRAWFMHLARDDDSAEREIGVVTPFAKENDVGLPPQWPSANQRPVRPKPVITSSAISGTSWRSQISRRRGK